MMIPARLLYSHVLIIVWCIMYLNSVKYVPTDQCPKSYILKPNNYTEYFRLIRCHLQFLEVKLLRAACYTLRSYKGIIIYVIFMRSLSWLLHCVEAPLWFWFLSLLHAFPRGLTTNIPLCGYYSEEILLYGARRWIFLKLRIEIICWRHCVRIFVWTYVCSLTFKYIQISSV